MNSSTQKKLVMSAHACSDFGDLKERYLNSLEGEDEVDGADSGEGDQ